MAKYGDLPFSLGIVELNCNEMMFYQYLPIKLSGGNEIVREDRLSCFDSIIGRCCCDFIGLLGLNRFIEAYVYLTAKHMYQAPGCSFNRPGYHSDGYKTPDLNYIVSDVHPTVFNTSEFVLSEDENQSMVDMQKQADARNNHTFLNNTLLRLNQYNIHKVNDFPYIGMRTFVKVSFSKDRYDLKGNSHNYLLDYEWEMRERAATRNVPQTLTN